MEEHVSGFIRAIAAYALLLSIASIGAAQEAPFVVPDPDIRVMINGAMLRSIVKSSDGIMWGGEWNKGGVICSSPDLHLELQGPDLWVRGWTNWVDGNGGLHALILGTPKMFTNDQGCGAIGLAAGCRIQGCVNDMFPGLMLLSGACKFFGFDIWNESIPLPSPITVPQQIAIELPAGPQKIENGEIFFEFGSFNGASWEKSPFPSIRRIPLLGIPRALGGRPLAPQVCQPFEDPRTCDDPICDMSKAATRVQMRRDVEQFGVDSFTQPYTTLTAASEEAAEKLLREGSPLEGQDLVGIAVSQRFLRGDSNGAGFFQRLLPIRAHGWTQISNRVVEFEFFLTDAGVVFGKTSGRDALQASFAITGAQAWLKDTPERRFRIEKIRAEAAASLPGFRSDPADPTKAVLDMQLLQLRFGVSSPVGDLNLCIESAEISAGFTKLFPVLARYPGPEKLFPDCIDAAVPNLKAFGPCSDGKQDQRLSLERPDRNPTLGLDLAKARSRIENGRLLISIPRVN